MVLSATDVIQKKSVSVFNGKYRYQLLAAITGEQTATEKWSKVHSNNTAVSKNMQFVFNSQIFLLPPFIYFLLLTFYKQFYILIFVINYYFMLFIYLYNLCFY